MALVAVPEPAVQESGPDVLEPPAVAITPADPWPRPYYMENGLRRVAPYHFTYTTYCKQRWRGRGLLEIYECEFRDRPVEYYKDAIERGVIVVNGKPVTTDHLLKNGDVVSHTLHRHEPPVTALPVSVIHEDEDMIVINKPAGVPVHPAGRYNYNSVVEIIRAERGHQFNPLPCNRLDRLTSGIMFIGKNAKAAENLSQQISSRTVRKEYLARVKGEFPEGETVCNMPILQISPKLGLNRVRANGKSARTVFKRLAYYPPRQPGESRGASSSEPGKQDERRPWTLKEGYSIVRCLPVTGRTHQLRVHLQFLGHPIANDPIYCNQRVWGSSLGANDADATQDSDEDIITRLSRMGKSEVADAVAYHDEMVDEYNKKKAEKMSGEVCDVCQTPLYTDPGEQELCLWLHSLRYEDSGGDWSYVSPLPTWALPPAGVEGPTEVGGMDELVAAVKDENPEIA
ncbi:pseudouridine synthase-3 [Coleophoma cylindrospora]|uniref:Pseudouridine synthase n=1 Tax=Coleophoma cylindrospora TaxID=1849047 RepID=A0A3D8S0R3_9HELO|nr:pseudouridine synthase-3 [Coleophoma cylindrospora]